MCGKGHVGWKPPFYFIMLKKKRKEVIIPLETPSQANGKSISNCIAAKARCDLRRPSCSRCESRNIPCAYARPAPADPTDRPAPLYADNSGSVPRARTNTDNSGAGNFPPGCGLVSPQLSLELEALMGTDAAATTTTTVVPYIDYASAGFTNISDVGPTLYSCSVPEIFRCDMSGATTVSGPGFDSIYSNPRGHYSGASANASSYAESSLDVRLGLDSGNDSSPGADTDASADRLPATGEGRDSFSGGHSTDTTPPGEEDLAPWVLALADKTITPDPPTLVEHSGMWPVSNIFLFFSFTCCRYLCAARGGWGRRRGGK